MNHVFFSSRSSSSYRNSFLVRDNRARPQVWWYCLQKRFCFWQACEVTKNPRAVSKTWDPSTNGRFFWVERGSFLSLLAFLLFIVSKELVFSRVCYILDYRRQMLSGAVYKGQGATWAPPLLEICYINGQFS